MALFQVTGEILTNRAKLGETIVVTAVVLSEFPAYVPYTIIMSGDRVEKSNANLKLYQYGKANVVN
jgi:hypothetical protein